MSIRRHLTSLLIFMLLVSTVTSCMDGATEDYEEETEEDNYAKGSEEAEESEDGSNDGNDGNQCAWGDTKGGSGKGCGEQESSKNEQGSGSVDSEETEAESEGSDGGSQQDDGESGENQGNDGNDCGWGDDDGNYGSGGCAKQPKCDDAIPRMLGEEVEAEAFKATAYTSFRGGPIIQSIELGCGFDNDCCWNNADGEQDKFEYAVASGSVDSELFESTFGTDVMPDGKFLVVVSGCAEEADAEGRFSSCSILCTSTTTNVTLKPAYFKNKDPEIALENCVEVPKSESPGPYSVELPIGEFFDVVIVAKNFVGESGDAVIVDDLMVEYLPCEDRTTQSRTDTTPTTSEGTTSEGATTADGGGGGTGDDKTKGSTSESTTSSEGTTSSSEGTTASESTSAGSTGSGPTEETTTPQGDDDATLECEAIECDFEDGTTCNYKTVEERPVFFRGPKPNLAASIKQRVIVSTYTVYKGRAFNYVTGIYGASEGSTHYAAVYLRQGAAALMSTSTKFVMKKTRVIRTKFYDATTNFTLSGCCRDEFGKTCTQLSYHLTIQEDREWKEAFFKCPAGTTSVHFICSAIFSKSQGACGLDDIKLYQIDETKTFDIQNPLDSLISVCKVT